MADYRNLDVWQLGRSIVTTAYRFTELLPEAETTGLIQQIKSAAIAVPSCIADGAGRANDVQFLRLIQDALGAISALDTLVMLAADLGYVEEFHTHDVEKRTKELSLKLRALAGKLESDAFGVRKRQFDGPPRSRRDEEAPAEGGEQFEERPRRPYTRRTSEDAPSEDRPRRAYRREGSESSSEERPRRTYRRDDSGGDDRPPRRSYGDRPADSGDRPRRSYGDRPAGGDDRPPRRSYGDRPSGGTGRSGPGRPSSGGPRGGGSGRPSGGSRGPGRPSSGGDRPPRRRKSE